MNANRALPVVINAKALGGAVYCGKCHVRCCQVLWCRIHNCPQTQFIFPRADLIEALEWSQRESHRMIHMPQSNPAARPDSLKEKSK